MAEEYGPIEAVWKTTYRENVKLAEMQLTEPLEERMTFIPEFRGFEMQVLELVGPTDARMDGPESSATPIFLPGVAGIWVRPRRTDWGTTVARSIAMKTLTDYQSKYVQGGVTAIRKARRNNILIPAFFADRLIKKTAGEYDAPVRVPFDTAAQQVPANYGGGGASGLTVDKLVKAIEIFQAAEIDVDMEEITLGVTARQNTNLYDELQFTSKDFRDKAVFEKKRVAEFMGIRFMNLQNLPKDGNGYRRCPLWCKSGMHYGEPMPLTTFLERDMSLQYQARPYIDSWYAATRSEDKYVVDILCAE